MKSLIRNRMNKIKDMKKVFSILLCLTFSMTILAQTSGGQITRPNKKVPQRSSKTGKSENRNKKQVSPQQPKPTTGTINGHEWIDLGLPSSIKWAACNVGASLPSDYGDYFNYKTTFYWGGTWRLPTEKDIRELKNCCQWFWTKIEGKSGYKVVGANGASIFLPAAGYYNKDGYLASAGSLGTIWSSSSIAANYYYLLFSQYNNSIMQESSHDIKYSIRPVSD